MSAADTIQRLVGMQAQVPDAPYVGLWTRLRDFSPAQQQTIKETEAGIHFDNLH